MNPWIVAVALAFLFDLPRAAWSQVPALINYQGQLSSGTNLLSENINLRLRLFDVPSGGSVLYEDSNVVSVTDGHYSTFLGDGTTSGNLRNALATATQIFVEVSVNGVILSPRERMAGVGYALIPGVKGMSNIESGAWSTVGGGELNVASGQWSTVAGGYTNTATGTASAIGGGQRNRSEGDSSVVVGGRFSYALGDASVAGGEGCRAIGAHSMAIGLDHHVYSYACGAFAGDDNTITNTEYAFIGGGQLNFIDGFTEYSAIVGGLQNRVGPNARFAIVAGGFSNHAGGHYSFAAGRGANAGHEGTFVWADNTDENFSSSASNQFLVRASGGLFTGPQDTNLWQVGGIRFLTNINVKTVVPWIQGCAVYDVSSNILWMATGTTTNDWRGAAFGVAP